MPDRGIARLWYSLPVFGLLVAGGAAWVILTPIGGPAPWRAAGLAGLLSGGIGAGLALVLRRRVPWLLLALLAVALGWWRGATVLIDQAQPWTDVPNRPLHILAIVDAPVETRGANATILARLDEVEAPPTLSRPTGRIQIVVPALPAVEVGDLIEIEGRLRPTDPTDPWERRLLARGVVATALYPRITSVGPANDTVPSMPIQRLRDGIEGTINRMLPEPNAALLVGLLVGTGGGMSDELRTALVASGLTHVVVASGYNVALVASALRGLIRLPPPLGAAPPLVGVWIFAFLAGGTAPSLRAAIMASLALVAGQTGRGTDALVALVLAASAMLIHDPRLVLDLSFQLSGLATLGLIALSPRIAPLVGRLPRVVGEPLAATIAAELVTAPLIAQTFFQVSLVAPITNLVVAPLIPIATIGGAIGVALAALLPPTAPLIGAALLLPTGGIVGVAEVAGALPHVLLTLGTIPTGLLVLYALALLAWAVIPTPEGQRLLALASAAPIGRGAYAVGGAAVAFVLAVAPGLAEQSPALRVTVLDVGDGDAVLIRTPGGQTVLVDGGPNPSALLSELGHRLGPLERNLTVAVLTGADQQRLAGAVAAAERYPARIAISPPERSPAALAERWNAAVRDHALVATDPVAIELEPGLRLDVFPTVPVPMAQANPPLQRSLALRLTHGDVALLLAPSLTPEAARALLAEGWLLQADALVVPRQGESRGLNAQMLAAIDPAIAVISVGARNRAGLPSADVLKTLGDVPVLRTDRHGSVEVRSDGKRIWVSPERVLAAGAPPV